MAKRKQKRSKSLSLKKRKHPEKLVRRKKRHRAIREFPILGVSFSRAKFGNYKRALNLVPARAGDFYSGSSRLQVRQKILALKKKFPKCDAATGQLYEHALAKKEKHKHATLYIICKSEDGEFIFAPIKFKKRFKSGAEWHSWFARNFEKIFLNKIHAALVNRTDRLWSLILYLGWTGHVKSRVRPPVVGRRNKTKPSRRSRG